MWVEVNVECAACSERDAAVRYFRLNRLSGSVEPLCRGCWLTMRHSKEDEWRYFLGVSKLFLLFTIAPFLIVAALVGLLAFIWFE